MSVGSWLAVVGPLVACFAVIAHLLAGRIDGLAADVRAMDARLSGRLDSIDGRLGETAEAFGRLDDRLAGLERERR